MSRSSSRPARSTRSVPNVEEEEPDYRVSLAAERTYLAYLRTGIALTAAGVAVAVALPEVGAVTFRRVIGIVLVLTGAGVAWDGRRRFNAVLRAIRRKEPLTSPTVVHNLSWVLIAVALAAIVLLLIT